MMRRRHLDGRAVAATLLALATAPACMPPSWGANALLHPTRHKVEKVPALPVQKVRWQGAGVALEGWWFHAAPPPTRGTIVYLHGVADNRGSSTGIAAHFVPLGFDVVSYDSRAHGDSEGEFCTYGYYEKTDLARVLDRLDRPPFIVMGTSLGAAVALQAAADDRRIVGVISIASFSDLRTAAVERAPFFASRGNIEEAFRIAEETAQFRVADASPLAVAPRIAVPVLLIHGDHDQETPYAHSVRILAALTGPKRLLTIQGGGHREGLRAESWREVDAWAEGVFRAASPRAAATP
jgi:pimeloyl-ACP methyl ester carboxylesterase